MGLQTINNGTFDFDPSAEKVRVSFDKVKAMFAEIYGEIPFDDYAGNAGFFLRVKTTEDGFELAAIPGGGDLLSTNNLNDVEDPEDARNNLGLGSAAESEATDFATSAQGTKADNALQSISEGTGVSIDVTDPQNPVISLDGATVTGISIDPTSKLMTLTIDGANDVTLDLSAYLKNIIGGLWVDKDPANTNYALIENGDKAFGWEADSFIAFKQVSGNRSYALKQDLL